LELPWRVSVYNETDLEGLQRRFGGYRLFTAGFRDCEIPNDAQRISPGKEPGLGRDFGVYFSRDMPPFGEIDHRKLLSFVRDRDIIVAARVSVGEGGRITYDPFVRPEDFNDYGPSHEKLAGMLRGIKDWIGFYDSGRVLTLDGRVSMGRKRVPGLVISINPDGGLKVKESYPLIGGHV
jgi:hypothetical protein